MKAQDTPTAEIIETFRRDGIVALEGFLTPDQVVRIRGEGEAIRDRFADDYGATSPVKTRGGWRMDIPPVNLVRRGGAPLARETGRVLEHPVIKEICDVLLGRSWNVTALVYDYREPCDEPVPREGFEKGYPPAYFWHVDNGKPGLKDPGRFTLRFQTYLNDTTLENGAFGYAKGTHRLVIHVRERMKAKPPENAEDAVIDTYDALIAGAEWLRALPEGLAPEYRKILDRFKSDVPAGDYSDQRTAMEYPAGTVLIFHDNGMHRGNFVNAGHRYVYRYLCGPVRAAEQFRSFAGIKNLAARQLFRRTMSEPFVNLM